MKCDMSLTMNGVIIGGSVPVNTLSSRVNVNTWKSYSST